MRKASLAGASVAAMLAFAAATTQAGLLYGFAGQNLVLDTQTGLIWLPPTADNNEIAQLSAFGQSLRIASFDEVSALLVAPPLNFPPLFGGARNLDPVVLDFFEFASSGNLPAPGCFGLVVDDGDCVFGWAYDGPAGGMAPLGEYAYIGMLPYYDNVDTTFEGATWFLGWPVTLSNYPVDPCDPEFVCTTAAFRIMDAIDSDGDGLPDSADNCIGHYNPAQTDSNGDRIGNRCDPDLDDDDVVNFADLQIMKDAFFSNDADADLDSDGSVNFTDLQILKDFFFGAPGPSALPPPVRYTADAQPVLAARCAPCHTSPALDGHDIGVIYADAFLPASDPACTGQNIGQCSLTLIDNGQMPPGSGCTNDPEVDVGNFDCLLPSELETIRAWIDDGLRE